MFQGFNYPYLKEVDKVKRSRMQGRQVPEVGLSSSRIVEECLFGTYGVVIKCLYINYA